jgi:energy-coupling factor transporter transmembrane protein EcfT
VVLFVIKSWRLAPVSAQDKFLSRTLGASSALILLYFTIIFSSPIRWNLQYPVGPWFLLLAIGFSIVLSCLAARWGTRGWYLLIAWAALFLIYLVFIYKPPMWN